VFEGAPIAVGEEAPTGYRLQQVQMRRLRLVPPGDQPVDDTEFVTGSNDEIGPRAPGV
jgi:hypothetical protein